MKKILILLVAVAFSSAGAYAGINDGLVAYYPFNGNADDASGNALDGTVLGATLNADRFGNADSAYYFDGVNSNIIELPNSQIRTLLNGVNAFSATAWVYNNGAGDPYRNILRICDTGPDSRGLMFRVGASNFPDSNHNKLEVLIGTTSYQTQHVASLTEIPVNIWTHLAATYDGSKVWIYINGVAPTNVERRGVPGGDGIIPNGVPQTGTITMGNSPAYISAYNTENFNGKIDEVRLYKKALTSNEINQLAMGIEVNNAYQDCKEQLLQCSNQTYISLATFDATPFRGKVVLNWTTETEINNTGFNVWRGMRFTRINDGIIPTEGSAPLGANYEFTDDQVFNGFRYFYLLEDIGSDGKSTFHGPVDAVPRWRLGMGRQ